MAIVRQQVEVFRLESSDWERFESHILAFELQQFPAALQEDPSDLRTLIQSPTSIVIGVRTEDDPLAGYIASDLLEQFGEIPGVSSDPHWNHHDTHYIAAVVVAPRLRHQGIATLLTKSCVKATLSRGIRRLTAHMVAGAAAKIDSRIRVIGSYPDWYGTGRTFEYIEIPTDVAA